MQFNAAYRMIQKGYDSPCAETRYHQMHKGSNLFIHCKGAKPFTMGCVALDEEYMITILKKADQGMRVYYSEMYMQ